MKYTFQIVDVFSSTPFGGNQLAFLPDAVGISSGRMVSALFFGVDSKDGLVFTCAGFMLIAIGMLANYIPARGAGRINPITALRNE